MSIMSANLYKALKAAKVPEDLATKASEEVVNFDKKIDNVVSEQDKKFAILNTKLNILIAFMIAIFVMLLGLFLKDIL